MKKILALIQQAQRPLINRIRALASRALLQALDDSGALQSLVVTALADERISDVARLGHFGFASRPPAGSTGLLIGIAGSRTHCVFIAEEHPPSRMKLEEQGESAIYNEAGDYVYIKQDGTIHVKASSKVFVDAPEAEFTGDLTVDGNFVVKGLSNLQGAVTTNDSIDAAGAITSATSVSDPNGSLSGLRTNYNAARYPVPGGDYTGTTDHPS